MGRRVVATVYAVLTDFGIVRLNAGSQLFAFGPRVKGAPDISMVKVGDVFVLHVGPRLNKVLEVFDPSKTDTSSSSNQG